MSRPGKKWIVAGTALGLVVLAIFGFALHRAGQASAFARLPVREQNLAVFDAACALLESNYYAPEVFQRPAWQELKRHWREQAAVAQGGGLLYFNVLQNFANRFPASHVYFLQPPKEGAASTAARRQPTAAEERFAALIVGGPGFDQDQVRRGEARLSIVGDVVRGSPAERAGITPGWALKDSTINGDGVHVHFRGTFWPLDPVASQLYERTGHVMDGGILTVTVAYDHELLEPRNDFELRQLPDGATYLRFDGFEDWGKVSRVLDAIDAASPQGLVLDLRHNAGGRSFYLGRVLGRLLGAVDVGESISREKRTPVGGLLISGGHYEGPLIVLTGPATASSAEITAAAVQDLKRGLVIGRDTSGAVLSGQFFDLPDGGRLAVPVADYRRKAGKRIEGVGVQPDIWVLPTLEDVRAGADPVLDRAVLELRKGWAARLNARG